MTNANKFERWAGRVVSPTTGPFKGVEGQVSGTKKNWVEVAFRDHGKIWFLERDLDAVGESEVTQLPDDLERFQIVYKVVSNRGGVLKSCWVANTELAIQYHPLMVVKPELGPIMAFQNLTLAQSFRSTHDDIGIWEIWKSIATTIILPKHLYRVHRTDLGVSRDSIINFWKNPDRFALVQGVPPGSIGCTSIVLIEKC